MLDPNSSIFFEIRVILQSLLAEGLSVKIVLFFF